MSDIWNPRSTSYANFLDLQTMLKPWMRIDPSDSTFDFQLQLIADAVSEDVQRHIGAPIAPMVFGPDDGLGKFDGGEGQYASMIILPRAPVLKVISVVEYAGQTPTTLTEITDPTGTDNMTDGYTVDYRTGLVKRVLGGIWPRPWMPGQGNIWVTWLAGYNPIPSDMLLACLRWASQRFRSEFQTSMVRPPGGGGDFSHGEEGTDASYIGMPHYVEEVLEHYIEPSVGG